jgi:phospho-N-acetylmuramoyl-pentapeptide-transferase
MVVPVTTAMLMWLCIAALTAPVAKTFLYRWLSDQPISTYVTQHRHKQAATGAGLWMLTLITLGWTFTSIPYPHLGCMWACAIIGLWDDVKKCRARCNSGLSAWFKYGALSLVFIVFIWHDTSLRAVHLGSWVWHVPALAAILAYVTAVGTVNAVNLTDGMDGLAIVPIIMVLVGLAFWSAQHHVTGAEHVWQTCALVGPIAAIFLWYNVAGTWIMGDVGSLGLGSLLASIAIALHAEVVLFFMGGLFVIEALSVMLQTLYRVIGIQWLHMAPVHHHFEISGCSTIMIVVRSWLITLFCIMFALFLFS